MMAHTRGCPEEGDRGDSSISGSWECAPNGEQPPETQDSLKEAASTQSPATSSEPYRSDGEVSTETSPDLSAIKPDVESGLEVKEVKSTQALVSLWTRRTIGLPLGTFVLAFLNSIATGVGYGFFLGYLGLDSYVMSSVQALMKLPEVLLLPFGVINDCVPICGHHRKPYLLLGLVMSAGALLLMSVKEQPAPYFCQRADGSYNYKVPPCNPDAHEDKSWYVACLVLLSVGVQMGCVATEGLLLELSRLEPVERRGTIKAEMTIVNLAGSLAATLVVGFGMNGKEYLGTFTWGLSFQQLMGVCCVLALLLVPISAFCVHEPPKRERSSLRMHVRASWQLVKQKALASIFIFAFVVQFSVMVTTTAGNNVKSQWAEVKVLQQQLFSMAGVFVMMLTIWAYKSYFLQASWKKIFVFAIVSPSVLDAIPSLMTVLNVVRNQYFFLGDDVISAIPQATIMLLSGLVMIEMAEPGQEGLCYGLMGTLQKSAMPFATVVSNQVFGLFNPSLSNVANYVSDTPSFRMTVAWSYALTYGSSLAALAALPLIPRQKAEAHQRKREWGTCRHIARMVLVLPAACLTYGVAVLVLASSPETACSRLAGGPGC